MCREQRRERKTTDGLARGVPGSRRDFGAGWYVGKPILIFSFI